MRHLDDGTLHAYLDGELVSGSAGAADRQSHGSADSEYSVGENERLTREEVEQHLGECESCRDALETARRLKDASADILSAAGPESFRAPEFAELQARARARGAEVGEKVKNVTGQRLGGLVNMRTLAWAATVVLAASVGWYARSALFYSEPSDTASEGETSGRIAIPIPETQGPETKTDSTAAGVESRPRMRGAAAQGEPAPLEPSSEPADSRSEEQVADAGEVPAAPAEATETEADEARADSPAMIAPTPAYVAEREKREAPEQSRTALDRAVPMPVMSRVTAGRGESGSDTWIDIDEEAAAAILGRPVPRIEGLQVLGYASLPDQESRTVKVEQILESGEIVRLVATAATDAVRAPEEGKAARRISAAGVVGTDSVRSIAVSRGDLTIDLSATLPDDSLRLLAEKIATP